VYTLKLPQNAQGYPRTITLRMPTPSGWRDVMIIFILPCIVCFHDFLIMPFHAATKVVLTNCHLKQKNMFYTGCRHGSSNWATVCFAFATAKPWWFVATPRCLHCKMKSPGWPRPFTDSHLPHVLIHITMVLSAQSTEISAHTSNMFPTPTLNHFS
jgi:hypothetical protein